MRRYLLVCNHFRRLCTWGWMFFRHRRCSCIHLLLPRQHVLHPFSSVLLLDWPWFRLHFRICSIINLLLISKSAQVQINAWCLGQQQLTRNDICPLHSFRIPIERFGSHCISFLNEFFWALWLRFQCGLFCLSTQPVQFSLVSHFR